MILLVALALLLAGPARADDAPSLAELPAARAAPGWTRQGSSLLLYGGDGSLAAELPLHDADEAGSASHETRGGTSPDGRLAWTLDRRLVYTPGRTRLLESRREFKLFGSDAVPLWDDDEADLPERGEPALFSADGRTLLLARRAEGGWTVEARTWMGKPLGALGPYPKLVSMALTPNGRYALARWAVPDKSDTHTFLDLSTKATKDVASSDLVLGLARIGDDGVARSGSKVVFAFDVAAATAAAVAPSTAPAPGAAR